MINLFQALLLILVAFAMFYFMVLARRSAVQRLFVVAFFSVVGLCVVFPEATTIVAHLVGIGRGVDLVTYLAVFFLFVAMFQQSLRMKQSDARMTLLVRALALHAPVQTAPLKDSDA